MIQEIIVAITIILAIYIAFKKMYKAFKNDGGACSSCNYKENCCSYNSIKNDITCHVKDSVTKP